MTQSRYNKPMKITGVYQIFIGDYFYFGSSIDCDSRKNSHLRSLKRGDHINKFMQNAFNKYGIFDFQIIVDCDNRDAAYAYEQDFIDTHFGLDKCLNLNAFASKPPKAKKGRAPHNKGKRGLYIASEETRRKISESNKGRVCYWKGKTSPNKGKKTGKPAHNAGKSASQETRQKISERHKGKPWSPARRAAQKNKEKS